MNEFNKNYYHCKNNSQLTIWFQHFLHNIKHYIKSNALWKMQKQNAKSYSGNSIALHNPVFNPWFIINYIVHKKI